LLKDVKKNTRIFCLIILVAIAFAVHAHADKGLNKTKLPGSLSPGIDHLFALVGPDTKDVFDPLQVAPIIGFLRQSKHQDAIYYADKKEGSPSAYHEFDVQRSFADILKYNFNPDIPGVALAPASCRLSRWKEVDNNSYKSAGLWQQLNELERPIVIKGIELFENTPDTFSGAYYKYDLYRTIIVFIYENRRVLISVSKQKDVSQVGNKGYILGSDDDWDYFYSGEPGLTISGLGWVRSYLYDSCGINIYYQIDEKKPVVRCATLRWIRAGWAKINVVKSHHIHAGLLRFARSFKVIMESPRLPSVEELTSAFSEINNMSTALLQDKINRYVDILQRRYNKSRSSSVKWKPDQLQDMGHWAKMSRQEMQSVLAVEYMKSVLGKTRKEEIANLLPVALQ
jgi:hypothetical protein